MGGEPEAVAVERRPARGVRARRRGDGRAVAAGTDRRRHARMTAASSTGHPVRPVPGNARTTQACGLGRHNRERAPPRRARRLPALPTRTCLAGARRARTRAPPPRARPAARGARPAGPRQRRLRRPPRAGPGRPAVDRHRRGACPGAAARRGRASPPVSPGGRQRAAPVGGHGTDVRPGVELLVRTLDPAPAVLLSRRLDLLVWNPTAEALLGPFGTERNYARLVFGDPATRALHADWDEAAHQTIALLRSAAARHPDDARCGLVADFVRTATSRSAGGDPRRRAEAPRAQALPPPGWRVTSTTRRSSWPTTATRS